MFDVTFHIITVLLSILLTTYLKLDDQFVISDLNRKTDLYFNLNRQRRRRRNFNPS